jgi:hypothetical protein
MKAYIPLAIGQHILRDSCKSLAAQTIAIDIVPCCTAGVLKSARGAYPNLIAKVTGEISSRNLALDLMRTSEEEFAVMQDRDVFHIFANNYERLLEYMTATPDCGAVALPWKENPNDAHVKICAMLIRVAAMESMRFRQDARYHVCLTFAEDVRAAGYRCEHLPIETRLIRELE